MNEVSEDFKYSIFPDRVQLNGLEPIPEEWIKKADEHLRQHPEKYLRLFWFEGEHRNQLDFLQKFKYLNALHIDFDTDQIELIGTLKKLKYLHLLLSKKRSLAPIESLTGLHKLTLISTAKTELTLPDFKALKNIQQLELHGSYNNLESINEMPDLRTLTLGVTVENLEFLKPKGKLSYLYFSKGIKDLKGIENLTDLSFLHLNHIQNLKIEGLKPIAKIKKLRGLRLDYLPHLQDFQWLKGAQIEEIYLVGLSGLKSMSGLEALKKLKLVATAGEFKQRGAMDLDALLECESLESVSLSKSIAKNATFTKILSQLEGKMVNIRSIDWHDFEAEKFI